MFMEHLPYHKLKYFIIEFFKPLRFVKFYYVKFIKEVIVILLYYSIQIINLLAI